MTPPAPISRDELKDTLANLLADGRSIGHTRAVSAVEWQKFTGNAMQRVDEYVAQEIGKGQEQLLQDFRPELPWPKDIFGEVTSDEFGVIDKLLTEHLGFRIDRVSATLMRRGWAIYEQQLKEFLAEAHLSDSEVTEKNLGNPSSGKATPLPKPKEE